MRGLGDRPIRGSLDYPFCAYRDLWPPSSLALRPTVLGQFLQHMRPRFNKTPAPARAIPTGRRFGTWYPGDSGRSALAIPASAHSEQRSGFTTNLAGSALLSHTVRLPYGSDGSVLKRQQISSVLISVLSLPETGRKPARFQRHLQN